MKKVLKGRHNQDYNVLKDQAVLKASELVQLLNDQLQKQKQIRFEVSAELENSRSLLKMYKGKQIEYATYEREQRKWDQQIKRLRDIISGRDSENKNLQDKIKDLHLKIVDILDKNKCISKELEQLKIKNGSLAHENLYLLDLYKDFKEKEKEFEDTKSKNQEVLKKQILEITNLKNAFSNRVDQLTKELQQLRRIPRRDKQNIFINSESNYLHDQILALKRENQFLHSEIGGLRERLFSKEKSFINETYVSQFNQTKKYHSNQFRRDQIYEYIDRLYEELQLKPNFITNKHDVGLRKYLQIQEYLLKHIDSMMFVILKLVGKYMFKVDENTGYKTHRLEQISAMGQQLLLKLCTD